MFEGGLAELHTHLGGSVASDIMWSLAHEQGIALPVKDYWEFDRLVTVSDPRGVDGLDALNEIYHWTELIQSSPIAVEQSVHGAIGGLDRASIEYPQVRCGLILMMDRTFTHEQNGIIVEKAIRWASRGVVGIDIAGPRPGGQRYRYRELLPLIEEARSAGLGVTIHVGEEGDEHGLAEGGEGGGTLRPDRIGHGILAAKDAELMATIRGLEIV